MPTGTRIDELQRSVLCRRRCTSSSYYTRRPTHRRCNALRAKIKTATPAYDHLPIGSKPLRLSLYNVSAIRGSAHPPKGRHGRCRQGCGLAKPATPTGRIENGLFIGTTSGNDLWAPYDADFDGHPDARQLVIEPRYAVERTCECRGASCHHQGWGGPVDRTHVS
jgi:hypothetical protein